ncbi:MAG: phosphoenolpyruvate carboxylase [Pirellulaceae bacterium]|nr:phosphoenolpyruvate carboxylase [Pirellulaceae bacterium]
MNSPEANELREEIGYLGAILGDTIREIEGDQAFELIEIIRHSSRERRIGGEDADQQIKTLIARLDARGLRVAIRAFTVFLDLLNLAEDRQRIRILQHRADEAYPGAGSESVRAAVTDLKGSGMDPAEMQRLVDQQHIELVFTAHPTEAKRRSVRSKLRAIRKLMQKRSTELGAAECDSVDRRIRSEVAKLWQTDFVRPWRPSVMQEVGRGLSIKPVLWDTVPRINQDLSQALRENYGDQVAASQPVVTFGSWIGGDRDGHPGVVAEVTNDTFDWLRREAITFHLRSCDSLSDSLSLSQRQVPVADELLSKIDQAKKTWSETKDRLAPIPPGEVFRQWLQVIRWRLEHSFPDDTVTPDGQHPAAYATACDLAADVAIVREALGEIPGSEYTVREVQVWQTQINTFGLHLARLDVRQNAKVYREVLHELFQRLGKCDDYLALDEAGKCAVLQATLAESLALEANRWSPDTAETLQLFRTLHRVAVRYSRAAIGAHVISMTSQPSAVLAVLWFWQQTRPNDLESSRCCVPIAPLLETIDDLRHGPDILTGMLAIPAYREQLRLHGDRQMIMLGYSDSTKDGGYLSACWSLHQAQQDLTAIAEQHGIELTFFHGRGGSLGRGGGPAARSILSLPKGTFHGHLRLTEQGEVLADRYDNPQIAYRHLEQVVWSSMLATHQTAQTDSSDWYPMMNDLADRSLAAYRELITRPSFIEYFRRATPISEIEQLPIGSRPSRRKPDGGLEDLRAIPWVFSWTQSRCLIPAWFGLGAAMQSDLEDYEVLSKWREMYQQWSFFRAMINNAELALAKSDLQIAGEYAGLANDSEPLRSIAAMVQQEFNASRSVVLALTERDELLDDTPWLKESIQMRNRYIDPLNLIQIELLRRSHEQNSAIEPDEHQHLSRLTINGIAAGMRTSG